VPRLPPLNQNMQNIVINMCGKFDYDRLRNDRALADRKSDNNKKKKNNNNNVRSAWRHVSGSEKCMFDHVCIVSFVVRYVSL